MWCVVKNEYELRGLLFVIPFLCKNDKYESSNSRVWQDGPSDRRIIVGAWAWGVADH